MSEQKPVVAAYQYQFDGPYGPVWRNDSGPWNGQTPIATRELYAAPPAQPAQAQPARLSDERIDEIASAMFYADEPMDSMARAFRPQWLESIARPLAHAIAAAVVPQGFVVVPEEPTEAMCKAGDDCQDSDPSMDDSPSYYTWRAMLAAAKATK